MRERGMRTEEISNLNEAELTRRAYHEAGHAVACFYLRKSFDDLMIVPETSREKGSNTVQPAVRRSDRLHSSRQKMEEDVMAALAGDVAVQKISPEVSDTEREDLARAISLISPHCSSADEVDAYLKLLRIRTEQIFTRNKMRTSYWKAVEVLAGMLLEDNTIKWERAFEIIDREVVHADRSELNVIIDH